MRPEWLFIVRVGPESRQLAIEVLSEVMTFAAFDVPLRLLFLDQGAKLLISGIDSEISGMLSALPVYGISELFVEKESLETMGISGSALATEVGVLGREEVSDFFLSHEKVFGD